jgi:5,10-methylenetetrahydromethanopterin reductase
MTPVPALGFCFVPTMPPEILPTLARSVERHGLDELWVWEDCFKQSGIASAAVALASTNRLQVGIGLLPVPLRNVALTAMELATLERLFPGRLVAGVGHGVQAWMEQVGARVGSPLTLLREYTVALRALLEGQTVTTSGRYVHLDQVALDWPPTPAPRLMVGGAGPRSLDLAAELGDGNLLTGALTKGEVADASGRVVAIRGLGHPLVASEIVATGPGAAERVDAEVPRWGREAGLGIGTAGDADAVADTVLQLAGLGVTSVIFQPTQDEPDLDGLIRFLGEDVRARLTPG